MADPTSVRYLPIRDGLLALLQDWEALSGVKRWVTDEPAFTQVAASQAPAVAVLFADPAGEERAAWAGNGRDHSYYLELRVVVRALDSGLCEDLLFGYVEAIEDALRADPTLGGLVRNAVLGSVRRVKHSEQGAFVGQAVLEVSTESRVSS